VIGRKKKYIKMFGSFVEPFNCFLHSYGIGLVVSTCMHAWMHVCIWNAEIWCQCNAQDRNITVDFRQWAYL